MIDPVVHLLLFLAVVLVIVVVHGFYFTTDDRKSLSSVPWRLARFVFWCGVITGGLVVAQWTVASVN